MARQCRFAEMLERCGHPPAILSLYIIITAAKRPPPDRPTAPSHHSLSIQLATNTRRNERSWNFLGAAVESHQIARETYLERPPPQSLHLSR